MLPRRLHRTLACLALLAMALLVCVPTLGRLAGMPSMDAMPSAMQSARAPAAVAMAGMGHVMPMAAMPGMAMMAMPSHGMPSHDMPSHDMPMPSMPMPGASAHGMQPGTPAQPSDMDCDYCPLLACAVFVAVFVAMLRGALAPQSPPVPRRVAAPLPVCCPCGLGSRGPPPAL